MSNRKESIFFAGGIGNFFAVSFATLFGIGCIPDAFSKGGKGGGLLGTLATFAFVISIEFLPFDNKPKIILCASVITFFLGWLAFHFAAKAIYRVKGARKKHDGGLTGFDYNQLVVDEAAGYLVLAEFVYRLPIDHDTRMTILFVGFLWFRLWDVKKPFFISWIEKAFPNAFGGMADDEAIGISIGLIVLAAYNYAPAHWQAVITLLFCLECLRLTIAALLKRRKKVKLQAL